MRFAVILAGGGGTRLWPASRRATPKQLLPLGADAGETLLGATARRLLPLCGADRLLVVTAADQAAAVQALLPALPADNVLAEPVGRNTAAAIGLAAAAAASRDADAVLAVVPADQHVGDEPAFAATLERALELAERRDVIATIGLAPTRPETGFGWLEVGAPDGDGALPVERFVEKPPLAVAERFAADGRHLWNGGIFVARATRLLGELRSHLPATAAAVTSADPAAAYPTLPSISFDHAVMEKASGVVALRGEFGWNDVGAWPALADYRPADADGNVLQGTAVLADAHRNIVVADPDHLVAVIGVDDLVVVQAGNAILVVPRARAQEVRRAVEALRERDLERFL